MKSNVKAGLGSDIARLKARAFAVVGLVACKSSSDAGLVMAPMAETAPSTAIALVTPDASAEGGAHRPTVEPRPPSQQTCTREVHCIETLAQAPAWPFSQPYDKCDPAPLGETGHFSPMETSSRRSDDADACCYVSFVSCTRRAGHVRSPPVVGRPLRDARGEMIVAPVVGELAGDERARFWADAALSEHTSVAEFARLSLALLALGAPADLVERVHRAALDEIEHAETCFAIASHFSGRKLAPGPLDVSRATAGASIANLVSCTLRDGCLGETAASIELAEMTRDPENARFADAIAKMADDEARHAELAWRILAFAIDEDRDAALAAIRETVLAPKNELEASVLAEIVLPLVNELSTPRAPREGDCAREA